MKQVLHFKEGYKEILFYDMGLMSAVEVEIINDKNIEKVYLDKENIILLRNHLDSLIESF